MVGRTKMNHTEIQVSWENSKILLKLNIFLEYFIISFFGRNIGVAMPFLQELINQSLFY